MVLEVGVICPECGSTDVIEDDYAGEIVCRGCGVVLGVIEPDRGPEWRAFTYEQRESRIRVGAGPNLLLHDMGLHTIISPANRDSAGKRIQYEDMPTLWRMRRWNNRLITDTSTQRNIMKYAGQIYKWGNALKLPDVLLQDIAYQYREFLRMGFLRGRDSLEMIAATFHLICRKNNVIHPLKELAKVTNIPRKRIMKTYRFLLLKGDIKVPLQDPREHVKVVLSQLKLHGPIEIMAKNIIDKMVENKFSGGKDPASLAAASIYIAGKLCNHPIVQTVVANKARVTEVTVRNRYKGMMKHFVFEVRA